jgi:methylmalonyl-CoA mutase N-terminal domain/subunit
MILGRGGGGLSVAFDMPTLMGRDSDDPRVPRRGRPLRRRSRLVSRHGHPLQRHPARRCHDLDDDQRPRRSAFCMMVAAERQGFEPSRASDGTLQTDIFKEYIAQKEWIFPPEPHLRLIGDLMEYTDEQHAATTSRCRCRATTFARPGRLPRKSSRSRSPTGSGTSSSVCPAASTSTSSHLGCRSSSMPTWTSSRRSPSSAPRAGSGRGGCATSTAQDREGAVAALPHPDRGGRLTAQQPLNNVVRTAIEALPPSSVEPTRCTPTPSMRPSRCRARTPRRWRCARSRCIMEETGVTNVADPLGGSWYVEALTDKIEAEAERIFAKILQMGELGKKPGPDGSDRAQDRPHHLRPAARDRRGLVHGRDRRRGVPLPGRPGARQQEGRRRQLPDRLDQPRAGDPPRQPRGGEGPGRRADRPQVGAATRPPSTPPWPGWSRSPGRART